MGHEIRTCAEVTRGKYVLMDTRLLINLAKGLSNKGGFFYFLQELLESQCSLVTTPFLKYELLCGELVSKTRSIKRAILDKMTEVSLPAELYNWMLEFSWVYASQSLKDAYMVDFSNLAYLRKFPSNLLLATLNHKDYSTRIIDREYVYTINDMEQDVPTVGFYKWNEEKYQSLTDKVKHLLV